MHLVIAFPMHLSECFPSKNSVSGANGAHNIQVEMDVQKCSELNDPNMTGVKLVFESVNGNEIETPYLDFQKSDQVLAKFKGKKCRIDLLDGLPYNMLCRDLEG
jgi:hypothetical protein